jgi:hypothetical protein
MPSLFLPPDTDGASRTLSGPRVRTGSLPSHRQTAAVSESTIRTYLDQAADVHRNLPSEIAFYTILALDYFTKLADL